MSEDTQTKIATIFFGLLILGFIYFFITVFLIPMDKMRVEINNGIKEQQNLLEYGYHYQGTSTISLEVYAKVSEATYNMRIRPVLIQQNSENATITYDFYSYNYYDGLRYTKKHGN
jgi:hypothetical protein